MLSICIPSFNQIAGLRETLRHLEKYAEPANELIEVVVSDNGSHDQAGLEILKHDFPWVLWHTNDSNLGFMGNLSMLVKLARGSSIWFLGCGDYPLLATEAMQKMTCENPQSIMSFGTAYVSEKPSQNLSHIDWSPVTCRTLSVLYESSFNSMVFPKSLLAELQVKTNLSGDSWPHLEWVIAGHSAGIPVLRSSQRLVCHDDAPSSWWDKAGALQIVAREFAVLYSVGHKSCQPMTLHMFNHLFSSLPSAAQAERAMVSRVEWRITKKEVLSNYLGVWRFLAWVDLSLPQQMKIIGGVSQKLISWYRGLESRT